MRRRIHIVRLTAIYKCLSILLDPDLVQFAILADSPVRTSLNGNIHQNISYDMAERDSLDRVLEVVGGCPHSVGLGMSGDHYKVQVAKLQGLLEKSGEERHCFEDPKVTLPMEVALDRHLSDKARVSLSSESNDFEDFHHFMSYLEKVRSAA